MNGKPSGESGHNVESFGKFVKGKPSGENGNIVENFDKFVQGKPSGENGSNVENFDKFVKGKPSATGIHAKIKEVSPDRSGSMIGEVDRPSKLQRE